MVKNKRACGLCKPHKKWKRNDTKKATYLKQEIIQEISPSSSVFISKFRRTIKRI